ncbi:MAG TPA: hypothetical protein VHY19_07100 [Steroidobacteraceae bacterium]|jgi:uncharacterized membrane protein|nr:hypothetical protein [Steroidobacteraceae bacterium]
MKRPTLLVTLSVAALVLSGTALARRSDTVKVPNASHATVKAPKVFHTTIKVPKNSHVAIKVPKASKKARRVPSRIPK